MRSTLVAPLQGLYVFKYWYRLLGLCCFLFHISSFPTFCRCTFNNLYFIFRHSFHCIYSDAFIFRCEFFISKHFPLQFVRRSSACVCLYIFQHTCGCEKILWRRRWLFVVSSQRVFYLLNQIAKLVTFFQAVTKTCSCTVQ